VPRRAANLHQEANSLGETAATTKTPITVTVKTASGSAPLVRTNCGVGRLRVAGDNASITLLRSDTILSN